MATPDIEQLKNHRDNLMACETFEEFKAVQITFVNLLIRICQKEEDELKLSARIILGLDQ